MSDLTPWPAATYAARALLDALTVAGALPDNDHARAAAGDAVADWCQTMREAVPDSRSQFGHLAGIAAVLAHAITSGDPDDDGWYRALTTGEDPGQDLAAQITACVGNGDAETTAALLAASPPPVMGAALAVLCVAAGRRLAGVR